MTNISRIHCNPERLEAIGASIGQDLINDMLKAQDQAQALRILIASLQALNAIPLHQEAAIGGFAAYIVNVLQVGVQNLPTLTEEELQDLGL